ERFGLVAAGAVGGGGRSPVGASCAGLPRDLSAGAVLLLADGIVQLKVEAIEGAHIRTTVMSDCVLSDRKGLNRLGGGLSLGALTDEDRRGTEYAAGLGGDSNAVSFCRSSAVVEGARALASS